VLPRLIAEHRPDLVWANSVPLRTLVESCRAARAAGLPFVADFHNEWIRNPYYRPPNARVDARHRGLEAEVLEGACLVVTLNPVHTEDLRARFPRARVETIENGFEPGDVAPLPPGPPLFVYAGAVYGHQGPAPFLQALAGLGRTDVEVRIFGDRFGAFQTGSWPFPVTVEGHVPHRDLAGRLARAGAGFLCLEGPAARQLPAKLYEYVGAGRPVFAIVPRDGSADRWIREHRAGTSVPVEEPAAWTPALRTFLEALPSWKAPDASRFQRRAQAGRLAALLDEVRR
jgi:glycosyltransferase involved in cell wall biosynthesis